MEVCVWGGEVEFESKKQEIDSNVKNKAPFPLPNFCCSTYGLSALVWWVDVITRVAQSYHKALLVDCRHLFGGSM